MSDKPSVVEALAAVMSEVQGVGKDAKNEKAGYAARSIDGVLNAVGPALRKHGVIVVPNVEESHYQIVPVGKNGTPMRECTLKVRFVFHGPAGDALEAATMGEALDSGDKATSKAHSMAFKTCLLQALAIPTNESDPDTESYERTSVPDTGKTYPVAASKRTLKEMFAAAGSSSPEQEAADLWAAMVPEGTSEVSVELWLKLNAAAEDIIAAYKAASS